MSVAVWRAAETDIGRAAALLEQLGYPNDATALRGRLASWTASPNRELFVVPR